MTTTFSPDLNFSLESGYRIHIARRFESVDFIGLPLINEERSLSIPEIYIPLRLKAENKPDAEILKLPDVLKEKRRIVVLGDPGSGKSTLVKFLAYSFGRLTPEPLARFLGPHLPIPIILRDYAVRNWEKPEHMLADFLKTLEPELRELVSVEWLMEALKQGRGALLLDGLDEVGSPEVRRQLRDNVVLPLLAEIPESLVILTSRIIGYNEVPFDFSDKFREWVGEEMKSRLKPLEVELSFTSGEPPQELLDKTLGNSQKVLMQLKVVGFECFYVAPLEDDQIEQFVVKWYTAREPEEEKRAFKTKTLLQALKQKESIKRLAQTPSMLTMMGLIHLQTAELPSGRIDLYNRITEAYLNSLQRVRRLEVFGSSLQSMKDWLAGIGWEMQELRARDRKNELLISKDVVVTWLTDTIAKDTSKNRPDIEAEKFLDYVARRSGLLIPRGPNSYAFSHLTFQEYFAAWYLRNFIFEFDQLVEMCFSRIGERHWHETLLLLFEMLAEFRGSGDKLIAVLLQKAQAEPGNRAALAELGSELLLDTSCNLSEEKKHWLAIFTLETVCRSYNSSVVENLNRISNPQLGKLMGDWIDEQFQHGLPQEIGNDFFLVAGELNAWNSNAIESFHQWNEGQKSLPWSESQVMSLLAFSGTDSEICAWAVEKLPLCLWLVDGRFRIEKNTNLANLFLKEMLAAQSQSPKHILLAHFAATYVVNRIFILTRLLSESGTPNQASVLARAIKRTESLESLLWPVTDGVSVAVARSSRLGASRDAWLRSLEARTDQVMKHFPVQLKAKSVEQSFEQALILTILGSQALNPYSSPILENEPIATLIAQSERLLLYPQCPGAILEGHIQYLESLLDAEDDWTRLAVLSCLLLLGEGTPERCKTRNALVDKGMLHPERFAFPEEVRLETDTPEFRQELPVLLRHIFLHEPGDPWLEPKWFDPEHSAAKYLLAKPRQWWANAAEVLDPEGKTELAKWRLPKE